MADRATKPKADILDDPLDVNIVGGDITISGADGAIVDGASAAIRATVKDLTNSNPLTVAITDGNGDQITSFGGGTQYTEADVDATATGTAVMLKNAGNEMVVGRARAIGHNDPLQDDDAGMVVNAVIHGHSTGAGHTWVDIKSTPSGALITEVGNTDPIPVDITQGVDVQFGAGTIDSFGHLVTGTINNQVDIQFYRDTVANLTTVTTANGGTATATGGMATFSATTTASSRAKGVSPTTTTYTAGGEIYAIFTAGWTGTGAGTSYQRIGIYNDNDGFYISKEANTFGVTVRKGGSDVFEGTFSEDALTGAVGSLFTRDGVPEAINLTKLNVWRIRFGWVGSAPINFEVLAPDGHWVTFHKIKQPNNASLPHIESADLPVTCDVFSGNSGAALTIITNCWAAGTTQALGKVNATITDENFAALTRSVITGETTAGGGGFVNVKVDPSGAVNVAGSVAVSSLPNEGQQTMANSISVAIASNQTAVPVSSTDLDIRNLAKAQDEVYSVLRTDAGVAYDARLVTAQANSGVDIGDVTINNAAGAAAVNIQDGGNTITVDGSVTVSATDLDVRNLAKAQDEVYAVLKTDAGVAYDARLVTAQANSGVDIGDVTINNSTGAAAVNIQDGGNSITVDGSVTATLSAETTKVIGTVNVAAAQTIAVTQATATSLNAAVVGSVAHDSGTPGNPIVLAGVSQDSDDTAPPNRVNAEADVTRLATDRDGSLHVLPYGPQIWSYHLDTSTAQTDASVHAAPGAGLSLYVGTITFSSGAATAINLFFEEGASKVLGPYYLEATAGRGMTVTFNPPKKITANTALTLTTSASIAHSVDVTGYTAQG